MNDIEPQWLDIDYIRALHERIIIESGEAEGIRDLGGLESAIGRAQNLYFYGGIDSPHQLAAAYTEGIEQSQAFINGNKRTGFLAAEAFLEKNGFRLDPSRRSEFTEMIAKMSRGEATREELGELFEDASKPIPGHPAHNNSSDSPDNQQTPDTNQEVTSGGKPPGGIGSAVADFLDRYGGTVGGLAAGAVVLGLGGSATDAAAAAIPVGTSAAAIADGNYMEAVIAGIEELAVTMPLTEALRPALQHLGYDVEDGLIQSMIQAMDSGAIPPLTQDLGNELLADLEQQQASTLQNITNLVEENKHVFQASGIDVDQMGAEKVAQMLADNSPNGGFSQLMSGANGSLNDLIYMRMGDVFKYHRLTGEQNRLIHKMENAGFDVAEQFYNDPPSTFQSDFEIAAAPPQNQQPDAAPASPSPSSAPAAGQAAEHVRPTRLEMAMDR